MSTRERSRKREMDEKLLTSRLAYHLRCLAEGATDPDLPRAERLALVRERGMQIRGIRRKLAALIERSVAPSQEALLTPLHRPQ